MAKQYAVCIAKRLKKHDLHNVKIHFDIWKSMNGRFHQRQFDPRIDIVTADWHPLKQTKWVQPLLTDLSNWRDELERIRRSFYFSDFMDVTFIADFPGLTLENYIQPDFENTTLKVLSGTVRFEFEGYQRVLNTNETIILPSATYHNVTTISEKPSCYMYIYTNVSESRKRQQWNEWSKKNYSVPMGIYHCIQYIKFTKTCNKMCFT